MEKLFALGSSTNRYEAELAVHKANQLIDRYQLNRLFSAKKSGYTMLTVHLRKKRIAGHQKYICRLLQDFFHVQVVLSSIYEPLDDDYFKTIELYGTPENVAIGQYCFYFIENQLKLLWHDQRKQFGSNHRAHRQSYFLGVVLGFEEKLASQGRPWSSARERSKQLNRPERFTELVAAEEQRLQHFVALHRPRLAKGRSSAARIMNQSFAQGKKAGAKLNFTQPLSQSGGPPRLHYRRNK